MLMFEKAYQYVYFGAWRLCRASERDSLGIWRAQGLLFFIEAVFLTATIYSLCKTVMTAKMALLCTYMTILLVAIFNTLYLANDRRAGQYRKEFRSYSRRRRRIADALTVAVCVLMLIMPFIVRALTSNRSWWE